MFVGLLIWHRKCSLCSQLYSYHPVPAFSVMHPFNWYNDSVTTQFVYLIGEPGDDFFIKPVPAFYIISIQSEFILDTLCLCN